MEYTIQNNAVYLEVDIAIVHTASFYLEYYKGKAVLSTQASDGPGTDFWGYLGGNSSDRDNQKYIGIQPTIGSIVHGSDILSEHAEETPKFEMPSRKYFPDWDWFYDNGKPMHFWEPAFLYSPQYSNDFFGLGNDENTLWFGDTVGSSQVIYTKAYYYIDAGSLFGSKADTVNFNALSSTQLEAIKSGSDQYHAGGGNDIVTLPNTVARATLGWTDRFLFDGGLGDDTITGGNGNDVVDGGAGKDTFVFNALRPIYGYSSVENKDNDAAVTVVTSDGIDKLSNFEIGKFADGSEHSLQKMYIEIDRNADGTGTLSVWENGAQLKSGIELHWDNATPIDEGEYYAYYKYSGSGYNVDPNKSKNLGQLIELGDKTHSGTINDCGITRTAIDIHVGSYVGDSEGCYVVSKKGFLDSFFQHMQKEAGFNLANSGTANAFYYPVIPITVKIHDVSTIRDPVFKAEDAKVSDATKTSAKAVFDLLNVGTGLPDKQLKLFFTAGGTATLGKDWDFKSTVKQVTEGPITKNTIFEFDFKANSKHVLGSKATLDLNIFANDNHEKDEHIIINLVDIDLYRYSHSKANVDHPWKLYHASQEVALGHSVPNGVEAQFLKGDHKADITIAADEVHAIAPYHGDLFV